MTLADRDLWLLAQWKSATDESQKNLERDDKAQVNSLNRWEDVELQIGTKQESAVLMSSITKFKDFMDEVVALLFPDFDYAIFRGLCCLIIQLLRESDAALRRIPRLLRDIGHRVGSLKDYFDQAQVVTHSLKEACIECAVATLLFFSNVVDFLRSNLMYSTPGDSLENEWQPLALRFSSTINELDNILLRTNHNLSKLLGSMSMTSRSQTDEQTSPSARSIPSPALAAADQLIKFPCILFPTSFTVPRFYDRTNILEKLDAYFERKPQDAGFQSLAIYGLGGVGKSSIALRFAENKLQRGDLDALFWIHAENSIAIKQSFTDIAIKLKLIDPRRADNDESVALVLEWLSQSKCRWFLIYDNAESVDLVRSYWPRAVSGQAIITARNHSFAFSLADGGLEIVTWDTETGMKFLFHLLAYDIGSEVEQTDHESAHELSVKLNGHALAISHMAALIHKRAWSISEFMRIYQKHPNELHGVSENRSINALWDFAFQSLSPEGRAILGILCYLAPDSIPQAIFENPSRDELPENLKFCADPLQFSKAIEDLLALALIKVDRSKRAFNLHRLVQTSFRFSLTPEERQQIWDDATTLISYAFPTRDGTAQMYQVWDRCALYLQHVISLKDMFEEERKMYPGFKGRQRYCELSNRCQRYLLEINAYAELEALADVNTIALMTVPEAERTISIRATLASHQGQLLVRTGRPAEGVVLLDKCYAIRDEAQPFQPYESTWSAENLANGVATVNDYDGAIAWHEKAKHNWDEYASIEDNSSNPWPALLQKSFAICLVWAGDNARARQLAEAALAQIKTMKPYSWAMAAYTHFVLGAIDRLDKRFDEAEAHLMEAQNHWLHGDQYRTDPFNGACMHRLGCIALDQGKIEAAIKHLKDASVVTGLRKSMMRAEHARCLFKLSEAYEQNPDDAERAKELREEAEGLLRQLDPTADGSRERSYDDQVHIQWR